MSNKKDACLALGELIITGFSGLELSENSANWISKYSIGGTILFAHNYENPAQVAELTNQIQECRQDLPIWVSVDHEGGKVQRFKKGFTRIPDAASIGAMGSPKLAFEVSEMMAKELRSVGINLNYFPIADILTNPKNPVIGNRSFGSSEDLVTKMCTAMLRGHLLNGVQACIKHFPGHGDTSTDSHFALPRIDTPLEILQDREFKPFIKAFKSKCSMVMTAHILNPKIDPQFPGTLSKIVIQDILRKQLRYDRLILTDDMEMKAITDHFGVNDAPVMALEAGCDLLTYRSQAAAENAYEACYKAIESGKLAAEKVLTAERRIKTLKKNFLENYQPIVVSEVGKYIGTPKNQEIVDKIEDLSNRRK